LSPEQSRASAIMEFLERYSWMNFDYKNHNGYTIKNYNEIVKEDCLTVPASYFLANIINLRNRDALLEEIRKIPLKWIKGYSLTNQAPCYYPLNWHNLLYGSNGLASGNTIEEAILQALCEVIERENLYKLFVEKKKGNNLATEGIKTDFIVRVLTNAKEKGINLTIKEISFELGIPTFIVRGIYPPDKGLISYDGVGQGTHPVPEKALARSLAEYFESFSLMRKVQAGVALDWNKFFDVAPKQHLGFVVNYNMEMLEKKERTVKIRDLLDLGDKDIKIEIERIVAILKQHNYEVIFVDKTNKDLGIPAVRVIVPGMRSLMSTEFRDPSLIIAQAYHEAGKSDKAIEFLQESLVNQPFLRRAFPKLSKVDRSDKIFKEDYREMLIAGHGIRKSLTKNFSKIVDQYNLKTKK